MKLTIKILFLLLFCSDICLAQKKTNAGGEDRSHILKVYNWADYMDMDLVPEFEAWYERQTGEKIKVIYQTFDINENMLTEIEVGHEDYDVVCPSEYIIERMLKKHLLQKIDTVQLTKTHTPNWMNEMSPWAESMFQRMSPDMTTRVKDYAVGYMWGTTGFLYNRKYVKDEEVSSWKALHNPRFEKQIYMKDAFRDIFSCIVQCVYADSIRAGRNRQEIAADLSDKHLKAVQKMLVAAKPQIAGFEVDFGKERMSQGKVWLNVAWSGDAQWAIDEEEDSVDLAYIVPKEGSNAWFDGWVIPIYAKNPKAAAYFIDFLCKGEHAVRNMEASGYVSVVGSPFVLEAMQDDEYGYVDASYFFGPAAKHVHLNHVLYPDKSVIDRCILMHDTGERNEALFEMWEQVKGNNLDWKMLTFVLCTLAMCAAAIINQKLKRYTRKRRRQERLRILKEHAS